MLGLTDEQEKRATKLHDEALVVDMLWSTNPTQPTPIVDGKDAVTRAAESGLTAANNTVSAFTESFRQALAAINQVYVLAAARASEVKLVKGTSDIEDCKRTHRFGTVIGFQTASPLEDDWTNTLPVLYRLGLRIMQLTYNERNLLGSGCLEPSDDGLTAYGRQVVKGMNALGIICDLSHVGKRTALDALRWSNQPVVFSHCNVAALNPHPRNLEDDAIRAVRDVGGIIGVVAWDTICRTRPDTPSTMEDFFAHLEYLVEMAGVDHVGIGTDLNENFRALPIPSGFELQYGGGAAAPPAPGVQGFEWVQEFRNVTREMVRRGYSDENITKILGGNFMRVAKEVWKD
jgi:membrane dipeptidase